MAEPHWAEGPFAFIDYPEPAGPKATLMEGIAREMALVHNVILRGLNAIYHQAPWVKPAEVPAFLEFCKLWVVVISSHHDGEEKHWFPFVDKATGNATLMNRNREQHADFHGGLDDMSAYINECAAQGGAAKYDGKKLAELIDGCGPALRQHLEDEIPTLLGLKKYEDKLGDALAVIQEEVKESMAVITPTKGAIFMLTCHDVSTDGGRWANWPPIPAPVAFIMRNVLYYVHSNWWRFAPCDRYGRLQKQYACAP